MFKFLFFPVDGQMLHFSDSFVLKSKIEIVKIVKCCVTSNSALTFFLSFFLSFFPFFSWKILMTLFSVIYTKE